MTLGQKRRSARIEKGWKQLYLANAINAPVPTVSRWETDQRKPRIDKPTDLTKARIYDRLLEACIPLAVTRPSIRREVMKEQYKDTIERMKGEANG